MTAPAAGIGGATALAFAREGARVIATDRDPAAIEKSARAEASTPIAGHETYVLDVTDHAALTAAATGHRASTSSTTAPAGCIRGRSRPPASPTGSARSTSTSPRCSSLTQAFLPGFIAQGGATIINVASVASSLKGVPNRVSYMSTKAAVIGSPNRLPSTTWSKGIRANAICPGSVDSPSLHERARALGDHDEVWKNLHRPPAHGPHGPARRDGASRRLSRERRIGLCDRRQFHHRRRHHDLDRPQRRHSKTRNKQ